jgi:hypothetical protein
MDTATSGEGENSSQLGPSDADPTPGPVDGPTTSAPGQRMLFLAGTALFVVGVAIVIGVQGSGSIAPSPPAINDSTPSPASTATPAPSGTPAGTATAAPTASATAAPTATPTPTDDGGGGLFGGGNDTETPTPTDDGGTNGGTETPTPTDDGGLFGGGNDTETPTPSPSETATPSPTPTDDGGLFGGGNDTETPTPTPTPTNSSGPNNMVAFLGVWPLLRGFALPLVTALLGVAMFVTSD